MAFVSVLFACSAIAPWNERGTDVPSVLPNNSDSLGKFYWNYSHSLVPQGLLYVFFFLYALEGQITECKNNQQHMPTPTGPASALMVIQAQLFLQLLVSLFNPEPFMKETNHLQGRHVLGHVAEEVPELILFFILFSSLDDQPDFLMSSSPPVALSKEIPFWI